MIHSFLEHDCGGELVFLDLRFHFHGYNFGYLEIVLLYADFVVLLEIKGGKEDHAGERGHDYDRYDRDQLEAYGAVKRTAAHVGGVDLRI